MKRILTALLLFIALSSGAQTINTGDTVVFDFSQASCIGNYFLIPVSFISDDTVYAIDFSMKFDQSKITYDDIITNLPQVNASAYFNPLDSTLRFSSFSMIEIPHDTTVVFVRFIVSGYPVTEADFNSIRVYLNGDTCSYKFIPPSPPAVIIPGGSLSVVPGDSVALSAPAGNGFSYLWSNNDTVQTIYVMIPGTYTVTVTTTGGCISMDSAIVTMSTPLPVELIHFSATEFNNGIQVEWATASEINNDYFDLERSTDNSGWQKIIRIEGAGNSSSQHNYSALDGMPVRGNNYYRLKQVDFNGTSTYSQMIALQFSSSDPGAFSLSVYPNPVDQLLNVLSPENIRIMVLDENGKEMIPSMKVSANQLQQINLQHIPAGVYNVKVHRDHAEDTESNVPIIVTH